MVPRMGVILELMYVCDSISTLRLPSRLSGNRSTHPIGVKRSRRQRLLVIEDANDRSQLVDLVVLNECHDERG